MRRRTVDIIKYVPSPDDYRVDFQHAWGVALHDAKLCNEILSGNPSLAEIIECELNVYRWLRFLSVRCPDLERCIKYRRTADAMAEEFATCRAKAASMNTRNAKLVIERLVP